jgi:hypothetical protein
MREFNIESSMQYNINDQFVSWSKCHFCIQASSWKNVTHIISQKCKSLVKFYVTGLKKNSEAVAVSWQLCVRNRVFESEFI